MGYLSERVSYLRGLADGLNISDDTNEGKLLKVIIDVLDDVAISIEEVEDEQKALLDDIDDTSSIKLAKVCKELLYKCKNLCNEIHSTFTSSFCRITPHKQYNICNTV